MTDEHNTSGARILLMLASDGDRDERPRWFYAKEAVKLIASIFVPILILFAVGGAIECFLK